jgi:cytochrome c peroxidase
MRRLVVVFLAARRRSGSGRRRSPAAGAAPRTRTGGARVRLEPPEALPDAVRAGRQPMSEAKVALGRRLFYEPRLSANGRSRADRATRPSAPSPTGAASRRLDRDAAPARHLSLANVAYNSSFTWSTRTARRSRSSSSGRCSTGTPWSSASGATRRGGRTARR